jgi:hypothetical protein
MDIALDCIENYRLQLSNPVKLNMNSVRIILLIILVSASSSRCFTQSSSSKIPIPSYGPRQPCNSTHICVDRNGNWESSSLYCTNKSICECTKDSNPGPVEEGTCLVNAGGSCSEFTKCEESAVCSADGICTCRAVSPFGDGLCHLHLHGNRCIRENPDTTTLNNLRLQRLICHNGEYVCKNPMSHDYDFLEEKKCLTRVGAPCNDEDPEMNCNQPKMECRNVTMRGVISKACFCQPGYSPSSGGSSCSFLSYGSKCDPNLHPQESSEGVCNYYDGQVCSEKGLCECSDDFIFFDEETKRCVSPMGYYCDRMRYSGCERGSECIPVATRYFPGGNIGICHQKFVSQI